MATSDLHGNLEGLDPKGADVVVLVGDIAPLRGRGPWHINDQKKWINRQFKEWTAVPVEHNDRLQGRVRIGRAKARRRRGNRIGLVRPRQSTGNSPSWVDSKSHA